MVDDRALTGLPSDQNFTLHCNAMKAIKSLNDQDVLVYDGRRLKWNGDLGLLRDRSLFIPQGGTEEKLKKVYIKKLPNRSGCSNFFYPTSNRNPRF